jgi:hypothetical protein
MSPLSFILSILGYSMSFIQVIIIIIIIIVCFFFVADRLFYHSFRKLSDGFYLEAGISDSVITEDDLIHLPPPVARYIRISGLLERNN